jgi:hypothetical protein
MVEWRIGSQIPIWLSTIKSQESPWFNYMHVACHISLENFQQGLQFCFGSHFNWSFEKKIMGLQSCGSPNFENFGTPNLGVQGQNDIWVQPLWLITKNTIMGKVVISPKFRPWRVLWVRVCPWFVRAPKMFKLCINQLVV